MLMMPTCFVLPNNQKRLIWSLCKECRWKQLLTDKCNGSRDPKSVFFIKIRYENSVMKQCLISLEKNDIRMIDSFFQCLKSLIHSPSLIHWVNTYRWPTMWEAKIARNGTSVYIFQHWFMLYILTVIGQGFYNSYHAQMLNFLCIFSSLTSSRIGFYYPLFLTKCCFCWRRAYNIETLDCTISEKILSSQSNVLGCHIGIKKSLVRQKLKVTLKG